MQKAMFKIMLSCFLCIVLFAAAALSVSGCSGEIGKLFGGDVPGGSQEAPAGVKKTFAFTVVDPEGKETVFEITTQKTTVGEALMDEGLIAGEPGAYGLYVKTVNGLTLDYDKDGMYWSFYVGGEYALTGVDQTPVEHDGEYMLKAEAAE